MKTLTVTLKQHTPLIHFQHDQYGATLRASEVKPKLDRFIFSLLEEGKEEAKRRGWTKGNDRTLSLNYKLKIKSSVEDQLYFIMNDRKRYVLPRDTDKDYIIYDGRKYVAKTRKEDHRKIAVLNSYPLFFGNMNMDFEDPSEYKKMSFTDAQVSLCFLIPNDTLYSFLADKEKRVLADFFLKHNFGTRQSKGFGSFYIDNDDEMYVEPISKEMSVYYFSLEGFTGTDCTGKKFEKMFKMIDLFYKTLRGGINIRGLYFKSLAFMYATDRLKAHWDKRAIKEKFYPTINKRRKDGLSVQLLRHKEMTSTLNVKFEKNFDIRDMLGFSTNEEWKSFKDTIEKKVAIVNSNNGMEVHYPLRDEKLPVERMPSPILIKPIYDMKNKKYNIYIIFRDDDEVGLEDFKKNKKICIYSKNEKDEVTGYRKRMQLDIPQVFSVKAYFDYIFKDLKFDIDKHVEKKYHESEEFKILKNIYRDLEKNKL